MNQENNNKEVGPEFGTEKAKHETQSRMGCRKVQSCGLEMTRGGLVLWAITAGNTVTKLI